jgi:hypothetical protein
MGVRDEKLVRSAGYRAYQSDPSPADLPRNPTLLTFPAFNDANLLTDGVYRYIVTAVDRAGNESAASAILDVPVPRVDSAAQDWRRYAVR